MKEGAVEAEEQQSATYGLVFETKKQQSDQHATSSPPAVEYRPHQSRQHHCYPGWAVSYRCPWVRAQW